MRDGLYHIRCDHDSRHKCHHTVVVFNYCPYNDLGLFVYNDGLEYITFALFRGPLEKGPIEKRLKKCHHCHQGPLTPDPVTLYHSTMMVTLVTLICHHIILFLYNSYIAFYLLTLKRLTPSIDSIHIQRIIEYTSHQVRAQYISRSNFLSHNDLPLRSLFNSTKYHIPNLIYYKILKIGGVQPEFFEV